MSPDLKNIQPVLTSAEEAASYVDPILFAEGVYENQQDYEQTIDILAERINQGSAVPRGREPKTHGKTTIIDGVAEASTNVEAPIKRLE